MLWDGNGLVVKRVGFDRDERGKPMLRLESANPESVDYTVRPEDAHIVGRVLWTVRKV